MAPQCVSESYPKIAPLGTIHAYSINGKRRMGYSDQKRIAQNALITNPV